MYFFVFFDSGNLASAVFVPYRSEVGPSGSLAGVIACLFVIFVFDKNDGHRGNSRVAVEWAIFLLVGFTIGLFPGIDNFANMFGFVMGVLLSIALLPHIGHTKANTDEYKLQDEPVISQNISDKHHDSHKFRVIAFTISMSLAVALMITLFMLLYLVPFECDWCAYLDCVPFTPDLCAEQQTSFERHMIIT